MSEPVIHFEHPDDPSYNLCGKVCTRKNPQTTTGYNVDCLECIRLEEEDKKTEL